MAVTPRMLGAFAAFATLAADQANKLWLIFVYGIEARQPVRLASFLDIVFAKNTGISYSLLRARSEWERFALVLVALAATWLLAIWLWRAKSRIVALGLGLIIGGALGNACDRMAYGFVADFYHFHLQSFSWYVFNLADVAICVGVGLLLLDSLFAAKADRGSEGVAQ